ncbi:uncharacterized protein [Lolium perenne]|uniref:uncharacterized protein n=1 Tax=Lolium perenne TaxID=4522 RepID=UPI003A99F6CD
MFIHVVGYNQRFRVIHSTIRRSTETISRYFQQVLYAVGEFRGKMIKPASNTTPPKIKNNYRWFPYFRVPRSMSATFRERKHYTSQNVLVAVDFDMRFTYVLADWEGSAHDASITSDSLSRPDELQILEGKLFLGDAGYACRPGILPPFRKTRYHLNEYTARNRPQNVKELFNLRHSSLRVTIERAFAALKNMSKVKARMTSSKRLSLLMKLRPAMAWRQETMKPGRRRGSSGQTQCGKPEATPPFEKDKDK